MAEKPYLLIDGDLYLHRACAAVERDIRWDEQNHVLAANSAEAWDVFTNSLDRIFTRFETRDHTIALSTIDKPVFRYEIDPTYKGNRKETRKPLCYARIRQRIAEEYNMLCFDGLEADDVCGILATKPGKRKRIIVSTDKDMKTIPATVWDRKELATYSEAEADYWHMYQTLIGDTTDGYKGCPGVGPKKAEALLKAATNCNWRGTETCKCEGDIGCLRPYAMWRFAVVPAYEKAGLTEADALVQARLARILRFSDWDSVNKTPILWTPA